MATKQFSAGMPETNSFPSTQGTFGLEVEVDAGGMIANLIGYVRGYSAALGSHRQLPDGTRSSHPGQLRTIIR